MLMLMLMFDNCFRERYLDDSTQVFQIVQYN